VIIFLGGIEMSRKDDRRSREKSIDSTDELKMANDRRIDALLDIQNKYVRTERHLEQNADITDPENLEHALELQREREKRMENLKNIIAYGKHEEVDEKENLKRNLEFTDGYLRNHSDHMEEETLRRTKEKQEHRKEQMDFLE